MKREAYMKLAIEMIKLDLNINDFNQIEIAFESLSLRHKLTLRHDIEEIGYLAFKRRLAHTINN